MDKVVIYEEFYIKLCVLLLSRGTDNIIHDKQTTVNTDTALNMPINYKTFGNI